MVPAPPKIATLLGIAARSDVFFLERVRVVDEEPIIYLKNYVVYQSCAGITKQDFENRLLFDVLEQDYNLLIAWGQRTFEAQGAQGEVAAALGLEAGEPVMYAQQIAYLEDDHPIELSDLWIRGGRFRVSAMVKRDHRRSQILAINHPSPQSDTMP
ncbi:MAG: UTRA domain-containing protein [Anaerolineae bacterium]|nr:UTRA domain-containing protein [Anaerolineae bacterium]